MYSITFSLINLFPPSDLLEHIFRTNHSLYIIFVIYRSTQQLTRTMVRMSFVTLQISRSFTMTTYCREIFFDQFLGFVISWHLLLDFLLLFNHMVFSISQLFFWWSGLRLVVYRTRASLASLCQESLLFLFFFKAFGKERDSKFRSHCRVKYLMGWKAQVSPIYSSISTKSSLFGKGQCQDRA